MYKIIKMALDLNAFDPTFQEYGSPENATLSLLEEHWESKEGAIDFVENVIYPENEKEWNEMYDGEDDVYTEIERFGNEILITNYYYGEKKFIEKYVIVEVK